MGPPPFGAMRNKWASYTHFWNRYSSTVPNSTVLHYERCCDLNLEMSHKLT